MTSQLPLAWPAPAAFRFDEFDGSGNEPVLAALAAIEASSPLLLIGPSGVGKTHLLVATVACARAAGLGAAYIALTRWAQFDADALEALAANQLLAIDEIDDIAGRRDAEIALFNLYNRSRDRGGRLLLASRDPPARLPLALPDLRSRLESTTALPIVPLAEQGRRELLRRRARARGFELEEPVIDFLFRRYRRDLPALLALVDRLDRESLAQQRRVTLPLVRFVLNQPPGRPDPPD